MSMGFNSTALRCRKRSGLVDASVEAGDQDARHGGPPLSHQCEQESAVFVDEVEIAKQHVDPLSLQEPQSPLRLLGDQDLPILCRQRVAHFQQKLEVIIDQ